MLVTELGIEMLVKLAQPLNASGAMIAIVFGNEILVNAVFDLKASVPIAVTEKASVATVIDDGSVIVEDAFD